MDASIKFLELKQAWKKAGEEERQRIEQETDMLIVSLSDEEKTKVFDAINEDFNAIHKEIDEIKQIVNMREILAPVLPAISISYLAKNYFNKTPQWFYQRMNGNKVNGKPVSFSENEIKTLHFAIKDISKQLSAVQF